MSLTLPRVNPIRTAEEAEAAYQADMRALKQEKIDTDKKLGMVGAVAVAGILAYFLVFKKD